MSRIMQLLAIAIVLVLLPMSVAASGAMTVSGSVTNGNVFASTNSMMDSSADGFQTIFGASSHVMGSGDIAYADTVSTMNGGIQTAYAANIGEGLLTGSASNGMLFMNIGDASCDESVSEGTECIPTDAMYGMSMTGSTFALTDGTIASATTMIGPMVNSEVHGSGAGSIGMYGGWMSMSNGEFANTEDVFSTFAMSGEAVNFDGMFMYG